MDDRLPAVGAPEAEALERPISTGRATFPALDGIRAIAAGMVVVYHAVFFTSWFSAIGGSYVGLLNAGVWAFFVTSGFLLYLPFADNHLGNARRVDIPGYAVRRVARIYPAYWVALAFFTIVVTRASVEGFDGLLLNGTLTQTYVHNANPFLVGIPPAWSLVIEITFYAFLPCYAIVVGALARRRRPLTVELAGIGVLLAAGAAAILALATGHAPPWVTVLPQHLPAFALGMLLAVVIAHRWSPETEARLERAARPAWVWWGVGATGLIVVSTLFHLDPIPRPGHPTAVEVVSLEVARILFGFCLVVPAVIRSPHDGPIRQVLRSRVLVFLGLISYGIYLWHWFLFRIVQSDWLDWALPLTDGTGRVTGKEGNWVVLLALTTPLVLGAATASWYLIERPVQQAARRLLAARRDPGARSPVGPPR